MLDPSIGNGVRRKYEALEPVLDERSRRQWAAAEAMAVGWGGVSMVAAATGLSRTTVNVGVRELRGRAEPGAGPVRPQVRSAGGGRKPLAEADPAIVAALDELVGPATRGDPMSPLRWTLKSTAKLAAELTRRGHPASARTVAALLKAQDYSLQANRKTREGSTHADRDAQFAHINARVAAAQARGQPAVSVDAKKKELVGDFKNGGREWQPKGRPEEVRVYDFIDKARTRAGSRRTGSTTWPPTRVGSASGRTTTRPGSRPGRSASGGRGWAGRGTRARRSCRSRPTAAGRTPAAAACGRSRCRSWPTRRG